MNWQEYEAKQSRKPVQKTPKTPATHDFKKGDKVTFRKQRSGAIKRPPFHDDLPALVLVTTKREMIKISFWSGNVRYWTYAHYSKLKPRNEAE